MIFLKKLGFTPCKSEQPLPRHGVTIKRNEKKKKKKKEYRKFVQKEPIVQRCLLILNLEPLRS